MREIKFRTWDKVLGICQVTGIDFRVDVAWVSKDGRKTTYTLNIENANLMQYTGLKDKKGKKIYEGDIVDFGTWKKDGERAVVEHNNDLACFIYQFFSKYGGEGMGIIGEYPYRPLRKKMKVIGNIYENPELLEGDDVEK